MKSCGLKMLTSNTIEATTEGSCVSYDCFTTLVSELGVDLECMRIPVTICNKLYVAVIKAQGVDDLSCTEADISYGVGLLMKRAS